MRTSGEKACISDEAERVQGKASEALASRPPLQRLQCVKYFAFKGAQQQL